MTTTKTSRQTLRTYFTKGAVPTESQFSDLIESAFNLTDDKLNALIGSGPLSLTAAVADGGLIDFSAPSATTPSWRFLQSEGATSTGFSIRDSSSTSRFFISSTNGNIGIGTTTPTSKLTVQGGDATISGNTTIGTAGATTPNRLTVNGDGNISGNLGIGSKLTVSGDASVTGFLTSQKVYFSAYIATVSSNSEPFKGNSATFQNVGNGYKFETGLFTAPVTGVYSFTFGGFRGDTQSGSLELTLFVNGSVANQISATTDGGETARITFYSGNTTAFRTVIVKLGINDTVSIRQAGTATAWLDNYRSSFEGILISAGS